MSMTTVEIVSPELNEEMIEQWCVDFISRTLDIPADEIDPDSEFQSYGLDSSISASMLVELEEWLEIDVPPSEIFEQVTIANLAVTLKKRYDDAERN